jgi:hypothetical protein
MQLLTYDLNRRIDIKKEFLMSRLFSGFVLWLLLIVIIALPFILRLVVVKVDWKILRELIDAIKAVIKTYTSILLIKMKLAKGAIILYFKMRKIKKFLKIGERKLREAGIMINEKGEVIEIEPVKESK